MDEMGGIFTNTTTATDDYFKESITANVTIPIAVLKELMGMKREEPEKVATPETKYGGIPETIQWYRVEDKTPSEGTRCLCLYQEDWGMVLKLSVFDVSLLSSGYRFPTYWAYAPEGPKGE